ncbi:MAG TPA: hypothetical protein VF472_12645 [Burkholderiaceae bacterium]
MTDTEIAAAPSDFLSEHWAAPARRSAWAQVMGIAFGAGRASADWPVSTSPAWRGAGRVRAFATLGIFGLFAVPAHAGVFDGLGIMLDGGYSYDSNLTNASDQADKRSDSAANLNLSVDKAVGLTEHTRLALRGLADAQAFHNYEGLDRLSANAEAEYMFRPSGEFMAPTFGFVAGAGRDEFRSNLRKNNHYSAGITWRQPLTDLINLYAALKDNVSRSDSEVFNVRYKSLQLNTDYQFSGGSALYLTAEYRHGDIVSTSQPALAYRDVSVAWVDDDVFSAGQPLRAYRLQGKTALARLGYNLPLAGKTSLDLSWRYARSASDISPDYWSSPIKYVGNQFSIDYLAGF